MNKFQPPVTKVKEGREWMQVMRNDGKGIIWVQAHIKTACSINIDSLESKQKSIFNRLLNIFA